MTFEVEKILASKRAFRQRLAARPLAEKLAMLDALRQRALDIRPVRPATDTAVLRESVSPKRASGKPAK